MHKQLDNSLLHNGAGNFDDGLRLSCDNSMPSIRLLLLLSGEEVILAFERTAMPCWIYSQHLKILALAFELHLNHI